MRIATTLFALVSLLALTAPASAGTITSTDQARRQAGHAQHQAHASAMSMPGMHAAATLPAVPSSTDDHRALAGQIMARHAIAPAATPAPIRVTSTDEARAAAGRSMSTPAPIMVRAAAGASSSVEMR
jgi:hypothetical protein